MYGQESKNHFIQRNLSYRLLNVKVNIVHLMRALLLKLQADRIYLGN